MPGSLYETVKTILACKGITQENLALELGIDRKTLYDALHSKVPRTGLMVSISVALDLSYYISIKMVEKFGPDLQNNEQDIMYQQMLFAASKLTVERCNDMLRERQMPALFKDASSF